MQKNGTQRFESSNRSSFSYGTYHTKMGQDC